MNITELYCNDSFDNLLVIIANQRRIKDFDDFRQDVFLEIIESNYSTMQECKRAARRVGQRYAAGGNYFDISDISLTDESGVIESEDETMSRLIYEGKARQVG